MSDEMKFPRSQEEMEASARKLNAEAALAETELEAVQLEKRSKQLFVQQKEMSLAKEIAAHDEWLQTDDQMRVFRFLGAVTGASVRQAVDKLNTWHRIDPGCDITLLIDSPGGGIIEGFHLFDTILELRDQGHKVTTITRGMAASMGGILLQAGDVRVMGPQASMLIHEAQFGAIGTFGEIIDEVEFVKKLQDRILEIFASRSNLTKRQIKARWTRKNWWLMAQEAHELGFVDEVR